MSDDLLKLAERCEAADGPDRELDGMIAKALAPERDWHRFDETWGARCTDDRAAFDMPPAYTASIDAARVLMQDGWRLHSLGETRHMIGGPWLALLACEAINRGPNSGKAGKAETPALALCAAALRARSAA